MFLYLQKVWREHQPLFSHCNEEGSEVGLSFQKVLPQVLFGIILDLKRHKNQYADSSSDRADKRPILHNA